jgi:predicted nucleic acid-binding protein
MATRPKPRLVAVDTNILLRLAEGEESTIDGIQAVRDRLRPVEFVVSSTAYQELIHLALHHNGLREGAVALGALSKLRESWKFTPAPFNALQRSIADNAARCMLRNRLLPDEEKNDARIVAESAVLNCVLLVSNDSHLLAVDHRRLGLLFRELDLPVPLIVSPREIVKKFYR